MKLSFTDSPMTMIEKLANGYTPSKIPLIEFNTLFGMHSVLYYCWLDELGIYGEVIYKLYEEYEKDLTKFADELTGNRIKVLERVHYIRKSSK